MTRRLEIVGIGGSVAAPSRSLAALELALDSARDAGAHTTLFDLHRASFRSTTRPHACPRNPRNG
jgi:multimeric flavodoxin WrbA